MKKIGLYGFSADPITLGHIDIIKRAAQLFDVLHVGIFNNPDKKYKLKASSRTLLVQKIFQHEKNIKVVTVDGLLVDYAFSNNITFLVRGIRNITDLGYEYDLQYGNLSQLHKFETVYLLARSEYMHISSSLTNILMYDMGDVRPFVELCVKEQMEKELKDQYRLSVTAGIASGKSTVISHIVRRIGLKSKYIHHIDLDQITRDIYSNKDEQYKDQLFGMIAAEFGRDVLNINGTVNKKELSKRVFQDPSGKKIGLINDWLEYPLMYETRKELLGKEGLVLISGAIIAEKEWLTLTNNNVLFINLPPEKQIERLISRDKLSREAARTRVDFANPNDQKLKLIKKKIKEVHHGELILFDNDKKISPAAIDTVIKSIYRLFPELKKYKK